MAKAGKVGIRQKGEYVDGTEYDKLDLVSYENKIYLSKKPSKSILPTDTEYWTLLIDLDGKLDADGDSKDNTVTFESEDSTDSEVWKEVQVLSSKEKHSSLLSKISSMMSNMRYLYKILGTADISELGSVTQAIANLNSNVGGIKGISSSEDITSKGEYALDAREKNASVDGTLANQINELNTELSNKVSSTHFNDTVDILIESLNGKAASSHNHSASDITSGTLSSDRIQTLAASKISSGTFASTAIKAATGTDYTTARVRNIYAGTTDMTAGTTSLSSGNIYVMYE